jgi:DNA-binding HxlR family transcriptional regulator
MQLNYTDSNFRSICSISCALEILGDKWTLLIIRDALFVGSKSFGEFRSSPEKIASNILTDRLEKLVSNGIFEKNRNPDNKLKFDYTLTDRGQQLKPILFAMGKWGNENIKGTCSVEEQVKSLLDTSNAANQSDLVENTSSRDLL